MATYCVHAWVFSRDDFDDIEAQLVRDIVIDELIQLQVDRVCVFNWFAGERIDILFVCH